MRHARRLASSPRVLRPRAMTPAYYPMQSYSSFSLAYPRYLWSPASSHGMDLQLRLPRRFVKWHGGRQAAWLGMAWRSERLDPDELGDGQEEEKSIRTALIPHGQLLPAQLL